MCLDFGLLDSVYDHIIKSNILDLEDFRFYFEDLSKIRPWVDAITGMAEQAAIQATRVRRAWSAVCLQAGQRELGKSVIDEAEIDDMLGAAELRDSKLCFWKRYRLRYPAEVYPSDQLISRISREVSKRQLMVYSLWMTKTLTHQLNAKRKKRKVGSGLWTEEDEMLEDTPGAQTFDLYMDNMFTYFLGMAIVGAVPVPGVVDEKLELLLGSDTTAFVNIPWDLLQAYFYRAKRGAARLAPDDRLDWVQYLDGDERALWVSQFRDSDRSLGAVIKDVMQLRDAHWIPHRSMPRAVVSREVASTEKVAKPAAANAVAPGAPIKGKKIASTLRDGTKLCKNWQQGKCKTTNCPNGTHKCGVVLRGNRVCGQSSHGASDCKAKKFMKAGE
jgi:hypothetical protein